jgi:hypothetical protein
LNSPSRLLRSVRADSALADGSIRFHRDTIDSWDYGSVAGWLDADRIPPVTAARRGVDQAQASERDARPYF